MRVVDLGCWPGGWLQVASRLVAPRGRVVGIDVAELEPLADCANVVALTGDLQDPSAVGLILEALGGQADVLLSDAAPKLTGVRATDRAREEALLETVCELVPRLLRPGGALLVKLLESPEAEAIARRLRSRFARSKTTRLEASRKGTSERYLLAWGYAGAQDAAAPS